MGTEPEVPCRVLGRLGIVKKKNRYKEDRDSKNEATEIIRGKIILNSLPNHGQNLGHKHSPSGNNQTPK